MVVTGELLRGKSDEVGGELDGGSLEIGVTDMVGETWILLIRSETDLETIKNNSKKR